MEISIDIGRIQAVAALYQRAPAIIDRHMKAAMEESLALLQREIAETTPLGAHQLLRKSIIASPVSVGPTGLLGVVGTSLNYAVPVELGTKPHMPPFEPLLDWVKAKLGKKGAEAEKAAQAIRWKIFRKGTQGSFMFKRTTDRLTPYIMARFERATVEILQEIGGLG